MCAEDSYDNDYFLVFSAKSEYESLSVMRSIETKLLSLVFGVWWSSLSTAVFLYS